jgi:hypothetical protein
VQVALMVDVCNSDVSDVLRSIFVTIYILLTILKNIVKIGGDMRWTMSNSVDDRLDANLLQ